VSKFNIFKILSKDDKELIHSAFLQFLLEYAPVDFYQFFNQTYDIAQLRQEKKDIVLEKGYRLGKEKKRYRFDVQIKGETSVLLIENKFKAFPYKEQLESYSNILEQEFKKFKHLQYLLCFDKQFAPKVKNWNVKDYSELLEFIKLNYNKVEGDERILINHYTQFLEEYIKQYALYKSNVLLVFYSRITNKNFWLKLIYSGLGNQLVSNNIVFERFELGSGSTSLALIEIFPAVWYNKLRIHIQLQGNVLKLYCHPKGLLGSDSNWEVYTQNHFEIAEHIKTNSLFENYNPTYKNTSNLKKDGTYYLVYIDLLEYFRIKGLDKCDTDDLTTCIYEFYDTVNKLLVVNKFI
jgi:predicted DNA binding CopG/RHH family protein